MELLFTKRLTQTDVDLRLSWPSVHYDFLRSVELIDHNQPPNSNILEFQVYDMEGCNWTLTCTTRSGTYPKPVISRGWKKLVQDNRLCKNDVIKFYKNLDPGPPIFIQVMHNAQQG